MNNLFFVLLIVIFFPLYFVNSTTALTEERKTILITGASGELGSAAAKLLAHDYNLILTGRNLSKLQQIQVELKANNPGCYEICILDFLSKASIAHFKEFIDQKTLLLSGFLLIPPRPAFHGKTLFQDHDTWTEVFASTFLGPVETLKVVLPYLARQCKIVVIAGTSSIQFQSDVGPSCLVRRIWTTYTKALSHELGPQGITINALSPGVVLTNFHQQRIQNKAQENGLSYENQMENEVANIPLHRHATPEELAQTIKFLMSEESNFINGINLIFDGGLTACY